MWAMAGSAEAQVFQTDAAMTPLPQPVGVSEVNLVTDSWAYNTATDVNRDPAGMNVNGKKFADYYPTFVNGDAITLNGLFKFRGEKLDAVADAKTAPGYFSPTCGFSGQLVLRGGDCNVTFGWYNVEDPNSTTPPKPEEIYQFIPEPPAPPAPGQPPLPGPTITEDLQCQPPLANGFCPLAWDAVDPRQLDKKLWIPRVYDSGSIKTDPKYKGGYVGFAVLGNATGLCTQTKHSMAAHNQKNAAGTPWITTLIYQSSVDSEGFYMAFEDLPMAPDDWHKNGVQGSSATNDGDFNDFVFYVSGISCLGGGQPCDTTLPGACSVGRTDCALEGTTGMCRPVVTPGPEQCDNVDNDCNGVVDEGDTLCTVAGQVCDKGSCVDACGTGEFRCPTLFTCSGGHCVEDACLDKDCPMGQACKAGACVEPCSGVVCPQGEECQLGRCVNPCDGVQCSAGKVCERGLCVSNCDCRGCDDGLECGSDGRCSDPLCVGVDCGAGQKCSAGECKDLCAGVVCPNGGQCLNGSCQPGGGGASNSGGTDGIGGKLNFGGSSGNGTGASANGSNNGPRRTSADPGCACEAVGGSRRSNLALLVGGLGLAAIGVARRRRDRAA
jgi:hypothetical protein